MSWENTKDTDLLWAARKCVLTASSAIEVRMNQMDPTDELRYAEDLEAESQLSFLFEVQRLLSRTNSALWELERRLADADAADVPD